MMADLDGKTCVLTGATSGIGEETALALARGGARLHLVARSEERAAATRARIRDETGNDAVALHLGDLASLAEIRRVAAELLEACPRIDLLLNNAGIVNLSRETTVDGFEATFAVNHLAYFALTNLLLDRLRTSAPARIVNVASDAHKFGAIDLDDLQSEREYKAMRTYGRSKSANILFTVELARRLEGSGVTVNAVHPGPVATRLGKNNGWLGRVLTTALSPFFLTPAKGARTSIHVLTAPELATVSGRYFAKQREITPRSHAADSDTARRLWDQSVQLTGIGA
jgi:NAD(P)-dependent dehydrogenase (short-subunit alcohol dehydrogenase family)